MLQFTHPLYLILILPASYLMYHMTKHSLADMSAFRTRLSIILRSIIMLLLILALAGARMVLNVSQQSVIFALDVSDSIPGEKIKESINYINKALKELKPNQKAGVIVFGENSSVEHSLGNFRNVGHVYSKPLTSNTDISQSLGLAMAMFPEQSSKKIVLLTDGNETRGKSLEQALIAGSNNISIDTIPIINQISNDILLDKMVSPPSAKIGEPFDLKIIAVADEPVAGNLRLIRNGEYIDNKKVTLSKGKNVLTYRQSIKKAGSYEYKAILDAENDPRSENNTALSYTMVKDKPKALYIEGTPGQSKYLSEALNLSCVETETRDRSSIPTSITDMQKYDLIILSDIPAWHMMPEQMMMIKSAVKDLGIGFAMIGGDNSFGAGGYFDTPIEETLPVDMSIRKSKILPSLSVVIVMDKSGSMSAIEGGVEKIRLANDAAASVVKLLQPIDKIGVIVCHTRPSIAVQLKNASNKESIYSEISTIRAEGGGISVFPSLDMAYNMIKSSNTMQKHIILLADGADCDDQDGAVPLSKKMAQERITISTVAIGDGPHTQFLKDVAAAGRGGFYLAQRANDLKAIFTKDVMTVSKTLIYEEPFIPIIDFTDQIAAGIDAASVPPLLGYISTSPKAAASIVAQSPKKDPILAVWQYGLGKSLAFTSDCKARWGARWVEWNDYGRFWSQSLRSIMKQSAPVDYQTMVEIEGGKGHVVIDAISPKGEFRNMLNFSGSIVNPDMTSSPLHIEQTEPGRYEADFTASSVGTYVISAKENGLKDSSVSINSVSIPYPQEYKNSSPNLNLLRQIASETKGQYNPEPKTIMTQNFRKSRSYTDLWWVFTLIAVLLLPFDIAVRRIAIDPEQAPAFFRSYVKKISPRRTKKPTIAADSAYTDSLLKVKDKRLKAKAKTEIFIQPKAAVNEPKKETAKKPAEERSAAKADIHADADEQYTSRLLDVKRKREKQDDRN